MKRFVVRNSEYRAAHDVEFQPTRRTRTFGLSIALTAVADEFEETHVDFLLAHVSLPFSEFCNTGRYA
jgi:hypothetical protein